MDNQNWINLTLWFVSGVAGGFLLYGPLKFILKQFHQMNQKFEETNSKFDDVKGELGQLAEVKSRLEQSDQELDVLRSQIFHQMNLGSQEMNQKFEEINVAVDDFKEEFGQLAAEIKSRLEQGDQEMDVLKSQIENQMNQKFEETYAKFDDVKKEFGRLAAEITSRLEQSDHEMDVLKSQIEGLRLVSRRIEAVFTEVSNRIENIEDRLRRVELKCDFPQFPEPYWPPNFDDETDEVLPSFPNIPK